MEKWQRSLYQPNLPLGADGTKVTASKAHITLSKEAAKEGMVLLKNNESLLPFQAGTKLALFGKHHKTKRRIWLNSAFQDGRHIKLQILAIGMHTCVTMDGYKRL